MALNCGDRLLSSSARHNLLSIYDDSTFVERVINYFHERCASDWPIVSNKRCGEWYGLPYANAAPNTSFKSTDGHNGIYNFSLKRMNLKFLSTACGAGAALIIDASKTKVQPDSFSKTIPIWCTVLNRVVLAFEQSGVNHGVEKKTEGWDTNLYTPPCISEEERGCIMEVLPERVQSVLDSGVIVDKEWFLNTLKKPLRCFWISNSNAKNEKDCWDEPYTTIQEAKARYTCIVCVSVSENTPQYRSRPAKEGEGEEWYYYTPGAADDHEFKSWSQGLTPGLFWKNVEDILFQKEMTIEDTKRVISALTKQRKDNQNDDLDDDGKSIVNFFDKIGNTCKIFIGSRKAGRPPACWDHFDAILNVTEMEYDGMSSRETVQEGKFYLQLRVKEGKKDRTQLEKWMAVAVIFIGVHMASQRRILVHCAQGRDRSVAVVLAAICIFCRLRNDAVSSSQGASNGSGKDLVYHPWLTELSLQSLTEFVSREKKSMDVNLENEGEYFCSGIPTFLIHQLLGRPGKDMLFNYIKSISSSKIGLIQDTRDERFFATKESIRIALMIIQQHRDKACPSRKTMQKINRFFMSNIGD